MRNLEKSCEDRIYDMTLKQESQLKAKDEAYSKSLEELKAKNDQDLKQARAEIKDSLEAQQAIHQKELDNLRVYYIGLMERTAARHKELLRDKEDVIDEIKRQREQYKMAYVEKSFFVNVIKS
jgi:hypothetical protein